MMPLGPNDPITPIEDYLVDDTGWVPLAVHSGFTAAALFARRRGPEVRLRGSVVRGAGPWPSGETAVMTLPPGFRPVAYFRTGAVGGASSTPYGLIVNINSLGAVTVAVRGATPAPTAGVYLDNVAFTVD